MAVGVAVVVFVLFLQDTHPLLINIMASFSSLYTMEVKKYLELIGLLPEAFQNRMKILLEEEWDAFLQSMAQPSFRGIRWNPLKCSRETLQKNLAFPLTPTPFSNFSYGIPQEIERIGSMPLHHAGAFYVQEPSASSAVTILDPKPGDRVLDLCAAPGGKSTQIGACLQGEGLLWSNEFVKNRAIVLLSNIERLGIRNGVVSSCHPDMLCRKLAGYFDKVLVDAPCSGEGMFRRDQQAALDWSEEHVKTCAVRQQAILDSASQAVKEGGILVYSTCTFAPEENEQVVEAFLKEHPEFECEDCGVSFGRASKQLPMTRRIFPMDGGDGHFVAKMKRVAANSKFPMPYEYTGGKKKDSHKALQELLASIFVQVPNQRIEQIKDSFVFLPDDLPRLEGLGVIRMGILAAEEKPSRLEPTHQLFSSASAKNCRQVVDLSGHSAEIRRFLLGEELEVADSYRGFVLVAVEGIPVGFGKCSQGRLKNRYPKGLRNHRF